MHRCFAVCVVLGLAGVAQAQPALVTKRDTNLRPDPSTRFQPFSELPKDTVITLVEPEVVEGYVHVMADGQEGWVWTSNISGLPSAGPGGPAALAAREGIGNFPDCPGVTTLSACDAETGCAMAGTSKARLNGIKNKMPDTDEDPATVTRSSGSYRLLSTWLLVYPQGATQSSQPPYATLA